MPPPEPLEIFAPLELEVLRLPLTTAKLSYAVLVTKPIKYDPNLLFAEILLAHNTLDFFDDFLAGARRCFAHRPLLGGSDE